MPAPISVNQPLQSVRQYAGPLDVDAVFNSATELNAFLTSPRRYAGMIASIKTPVAKAYILNAAMDAWVEIGTGAGGGSMDVVNLTGNDTYVVSANTLVEDMVGLPTSDLAALKIGTTPGGEEIVVSQPVTSAKGVVLAINFYAIGATTFYITGITSNTTFKIKKLS